MTVSKARVLVAPNSGNSIVGRDCLVALRYRVTQPIERGECKENKQPVKSKDLVCEESSEDQRSAEVQQLEREFPILL